MAELRPSRPDPLSVVPAGTLRKLSVSEIKPSANNPRSLFDESPLQELKKNIQLTVFLFP
jgi:hypothetical protein